MLCAAVADFTVAQQAGEKIKRGNDGLQLTLVPTRDIAAELGRRKRAGQVLVGFALETQNEAANARDKMQRKNFDFIVLNSLRDKGAGFAVDTNKITILTPDAETVYPLKPKREVAKDIVQTLCEKFN